MMGLAYQGKQFCWWPCGWQQPGKFFSKPVSRGLLLTSLFLCIPYFLCCRIPKALYFPTGSHWERLKIFWATWIRKRLRNFEDQSCLHRRHIWGRKFKNEARVMWAMLHASSSALCSDSLTRFSAILSYFFSCSLDVVRWYDQYFGGRLLNFFSNFSQGMLPHPPLPSWPLYCHVDMINVQDVNCQSGATRFLMYSD